MAILERFLKIVKEMPTFIHGLDAYLMLSLEERGLGSFSIEGVESKGLYTPWTVKSSQGLDPVKFVIGC